jgi:hypothetical protein
MVHLIEVLNEYLCDLSRVILNLGKSLASLSDGPRPSPDQGYGDSGWLFQLESHLRNFSAGHSFSFLLLPPRIETWFMGFYYLEMEFLVSSLSRFLQEFLQGQSILDRITIGIVVVVDVNVFTFGKPGTHLLGVTLQV